MRWFPVTAYVALVAVGTAGAAELSALELKDARKLYNAKCAKCHKFYDPAKYNEVEWQEWMRKMNQKAKLKAAQADLLKRYLDTFRQSQTATAAAAPAGR